jgi:hypothetical protein
VAEISRAACEQLQGWHCFFKKGKNKMKTIFVIIVVLGALWIGSIKFQEKTRVPVALKLIDKKIQELKTVGFDKLAEKVGTGYIDENMIIGGVTYSLRYAVTKMGSFTDLRKVKEEQLKTAIQPGETIRAIDVLGYIDCMTVIPFSNFKMGPSFILTMQKEDI